MLLMPRIEAAKDPCRMSLHKFYRMIQVYVAVVNDVCDILVTISYFGILLGTISLSYIAIRTVRRMNILVTSPVAVVDLLLFIISFCMINFALQLRFHSDRYRELRQQARPRMTKVDVAFFRSCRPIEISVGRLFTLSSRDFCLRTYGNVILETTINLLLTF